ncbi:conserved exported hypothetical protein [Vibrio chagasii]|nr:conserved exported hypothetical protein [Vibrio chagasii]CAH7062363.1 conserved exported hypothetical protein [Vibrio chagasii]CAH7313664.1 conserved exported hypothetical protein [Vibrio chagasii]CAH7331630.1 conserved exported hypothetical protein [Vibrio chagasii]
MFKKSLLFVVGLCMVSSVQSGPIEMAHKVGFVSCDNAINTELKSYLQSSNGRINIEYDNVKMKNKAISFLFTYGSSGDTVLNKATFVNHGGSCQTYIFGQITTAKSCMQYKEENPAWKYVEAQGDNIWTQNQGGVTAILKNAPVGGCIISFNRTGGGY